LLLGFVVVITVIAVDCDDLSIAIVVVILPLFAASKNRNEKSRRFHVLDLVVPIQVAFRPPQNHP